VAILERHYSKHGREGLRREHKKKSVSNVGTLQHYGMHSYTSAGLSIT